MHFVQVCQGFIRTYTLFILFLSGLEHRFRCLQWGLHFPTFLAPKHRKVKKFYVIKYKLNAYCVTTRKSLKFLSPLKSLILLDRASFLPETWIRRLELHRHYESWGELEDRSHNLSDWRSQKRWTWVPKENIMVAFQSCIAFSWIPLIGETKPLWV